MPTTQPQLIDEDAPLVPPTDPTNHEKRYEWLLSRFTGPDWVVSEFQIEQNTHTDTDATAFEGALSHDSGSLVQLLPFDPKSHRRESPIFQATRVRLRDAIEDVNGYVTPADPVPWDDAFLRSQFAGKKRHPCPAASSQIVVHEQATVHDEDETAIASDGAVEREYGLPTAKGAIFATLGAAQSVSKQTEPQADLETFF